MREPRPAPESEGGTAVRTLAAARAQVLAAAGRDEVVAAVLAFARAHAAYAAAFVLREGDLCGHDARGDAPETDRLRVRRLRFSPGWDTLFRTVLETGGPYLGPLPGASFDSVLTAELGRGRPANVLLVPVRVRQRPVLVLFLDNGSEPLDPGAASDLVSLCALLPAAFAGVLGRRKHAPASGGEPAAPLAGEKAEPTAGLPLPAASTGAETGSIEGVPPPRPAAVEGDLRQDAARVAAGGPGAPEALGRLMAAGDPGVAALAERFPGPLATTILSIAEMPPDLASHGPVVAAMGRLGLQAAPVLRWLVREAGHPRRRLYAVLLLARSPHPDNLPALHAALFDPVPLVTVAARDGLFAHRHVPGYREVVEGLRGELAGPHPMRVCDAVRVLARLRDAGAVPHLIGLLHSGAGDVAQEAHRALRDVTRQDFGTRIGRWERWQVEHGRRPRFEWLIAGLDHADPELRHGAIQELEQLTGETFGFRYYGPRRERARSVARWEAWWRERSRQELLGDSGT